MRRSHRNPTVGFAEDLFSPPGTLTPVVKPLEEMTEEELVKLPRDAFSEDEWYELDEDLQVIIREKDPKSRERVQNMVDEFVKRHKWATEPDAHYVQERVEEDFDYWFSEMGDDAVSFIRDSRSRSTRDQLEAVIDGFREEGWADDQIERALNEAIQDRDNWDFAYDTDEYAGAFFKASSSESFYIDQFELRGILEGDAPTGRGPMFDDEIEEAIDEINRETHLNLDLDGIQKAAQKYGIEIDDYNRVYADADPDWEKIEQAAKALLEDEEPEGGRAPEIPPDERVVYRFPNGAYVLDLLPSELPAEGKGRGICVGSKQYGYMEAVKAGNTKILSLREADGRRRLTIEVRQGPDGKFNYVRQVKGDHNRLPRGEEAIRMVELLKALHIPWKKIKDISDLKEGLREAGLIKSLPAAKPEENPDDEAEEDLCFEHGLCTGFCQPWRP